MPRALRWLILTDNAIDALPADIGDCSRLQKLMLAGNRLRTLPAEMAACRALELVRLSANRLDALPDWLLRLPRLAWLATAGNPFGAAPEAAASAGPRSRTSTGHRWPASRSWARVHRASFTARSGARTGIRHGRSRSSCSRAR